MANKWIVHVKKTMRAMKSKGTYKKGMGLKQVIMEAKKSWSKVKKGGADEPTEESPVAAPSAPMPVEEGGRRRRRHSKTTRRRKH
jgi:hypothetical protein